MINFIEIAQQYAEKNMVMVPAIDKAPRIIKNWNTETVENILSNGAAWQKANGINLVLGKRSGVTVVDIDIIESEKPELFKQVMALLPPAMVQRQGNPKKQPSRFFQYNGERARKFNAIQVEILSDGNNCCMPPGWNHQSQTNFYWVSQTLLDIDVDDLPILSQEVIDSLDQLNDRVKAEQKSGSSPGKAETTLVKGRCRSGSHNKISAYAVARRKAGHSDSELIRDCIKYDESINSDADSLYFNCKSRPWRGGSAKENAQAFIADICGNHKVNTKVLKEKSAIDYARLMLKKDGSPITNETNVLKILHAIPEFKNSIYYDEFLRMKICNGHIMKDSDYTEIQVILQEKYRFTMVSSSIVRATVDAFADRNVKNECREYMLGITWDGTPRIEKFFQNYCGADDNEYVTAVSKNFWIGMVARVLSPGCKLDTMVILEGPQGGLKSSMLDVIGGKWFKEATAKVGDKDFLVGLSGALIIELAELDAMNKSDTNAVKKTLSARTDHYRPPYAKLERAYDRQCVLVGTTNDTEYLKDTTGNRRFLPVKCGDILLACVKADRDQLFAESVQLFNDGGRWYEYPKRAMEEQELRGQKDPWYGIIETWARNRHPFNYDSVYSEDCLDIDKKLRNHMTQTRIRKVLRQLNYEFRVTRINETRKETQRLWTKT